VETRNTFNMCNYCYLSAFEHVTVDVVMVILLYRGFLHAHVSYLSDNSPACLMLLSNDREKFFTLQECRQRIVSVSSKLFVSTRCYCICFQKALFFILNSLTR